MMAIEMIGTGGSADVRARRRRPSRPLYSQALVTLRSDYERRRVLDAVVASGGVTPALTQTLLVDAATMQSDYELAEFLIKLSARGSLDESNHDALFTAVGVSDRTTSITAC